MTIQIRAPSVIGMNHHEQRTELCEFLRQIRGVSRNLDSNVILDFSETNVVASSGAVFLIGELDRVLATHRGSIQARRSKVPLVEEVFQQIGIYAKLGIACEISPTSESVIHWQVASGTLAEGEKGGSILETYEGRLPELLTKGLYEGIVESMTNTVHHAYPDDAEGKQRRHGIGRRWWMLSQERDGELTVAICDLGIGIPKSLPKSKTYKSGSVREFWRNTGLDRSDGSAISVAVQIGQTRTGLRQRGYGLADIVSSAKGATNGRVLITSNKGIFVAKGDEESVHTHKRSVNGTLVHWTVPIAQGTPDA